MSKASTVIVNDHNKKSVVVLFPVASQYLLHQCQANQLSCICLVTTATFRISHCSTSCHSLALALALAFTFNKLAQSRYRLKLSYSPRTRSCHNNKMQSQGVGSVVNYYRLEHTIPQGYKEEGGGSTPRAPPPAPTTTFIND